jgi:lysophospholipase
MSYFINSETDVSQYPNCAYAKFYAQYAQTGYWKQPNNSSTHYCFVPRENAKACVVLLPGRAEPIIKYAEVIYELHQNGYTVLAIDHKGQGKSSRVLPDSHIGYIDDFDEYVEDIKHVLDKVLTPLLEDHIQGGLSKYLLSHSMGGTIASLLVQKYPLIFNKLVLSTPMFGVKAPIPEFMLSMFLSLFVATRRLLRLPITYLWGQGDYRAIAFYKNRLTHSEIRYRAFRAVMDQYPENQMGGISFEWLRKALKAIVKVRKNANLMLLPTLMLIAEDENIVDNRYLYKTANIIPDITIAEVPCAQHEVLFEKDAAREFVMTQIHRFFDK